MNRRKIAEDYIKKYYKESKAHIKNAIYIAFLAGMRKEREITNKK